MSEQDDSFLSRWSRRKALVRQGVEPPAAAVPAVSTLPTPAALARPVAAAAPAGPVPEQPREAAADTVAAEVSAPPRPTLDDVEALTPQSDFSRFVARDVDPEVRNSALKKLFTDPHYNVMDGLDIYIGDYNTPDPLPKSMLRQLVQARMLGLLDDDMPEQPAATAAPQAPAVVMAEVEVEIDAGPAADAANDGPEANAVDAMDAASELPPAALPGPDAAVPFTVPAAARPGGAVRADDAGIVGEDQWLRVGPGSSSPDS